MKPYSAFGTEYSPLPAAGDVNARSAASVITHTHTPHTHTDVSRIFISAKNLPHPLVISPGLVLVVWGRHNANSSPWFLYGRLLFGRLRTTGFPEFRPDASQKIGGKTRIIRLEEKPRNLGIVTYFSKFCTFSRRGVRSSLVTDSWSSHHEVNFNFTQIFTGILAGFGHGYLIYKIKWLFMKEKCKDEKIKCARLFFSLQKEHQNVGLKTYKKLRIIFYLRMRSISFHECACKKSENLISQSCCCCINSSRRCKHSVPHFSPHQSHVRACPVAIRQEGIPG